VSKPRLVFRKRIRLFGPLYLNASLHHVGLGVHVPGASFSINDTADGKPASGLPGSGARIQQMWSGKQASFVSNSDKSSPSAPRLNVWPLVIIFILIAVLLVIAGILPK
jgi:hypothetical protein